MNDYDELKERLEMAELLTAEFEYTLEVETYTLPFDKIVKVIYEFNDDKELINIFVQE